MATRLSLVFASTAVTVALALPALAVMPTPGDATDQCSGICAAEFGADELSEPLIRVSGGDDDDGDCNDEDEDGDDDEDDDDDDDACTGALGVPAPAGTVAPPANGLFGTGAPPVAVTN